VLDDWHWVIITGIEPKNAEGRCIVQILDNNDLYRIDFGEWLAKSVNCGALVRILERIE
jgi:hypothetical protein